MNTQAIFKDLDQIAQAIYDKKGFNTIVLDVREICTMTDFFVIAEGTVDRHVIALSQTIIDHFAIQGREPMHVEGQREGDWVVIDYGEYVIHLFIPELREKYDLEQLWKKGRIIDVNIKL